MVVRRRKKVVKYRGSTTHGGGHRKKRRGAGSRGGRGRAGTGKKSGHKKIGVILGKRGFLPRRPSQMIQAIKAINVGYFTPSRLEKLVQEGQIATEGNIFVINLGRLGYAKLLGGGRINLKLKVLVQECSSSAEEKIKAAGGEVLSAGKVSPE